MRSREAATRDGGWHHGGGAPGEECVGSRKSSGEKISIRTANDGGMSNLDALAGLPSLTAVQQHPIKDTVVGLPESL